MSSLKKKNNATALKFYHYMGRRECIFILAPQDDLNKIITHTENCVAIAYCKIYVVPSTGKVLQLFMALSCMFIIGSLCIASELWLSLAVCVIGGLSK